MLRAFNFLRRGAVTARPQCRLSSTESLQWANAMSNSLAETDPELYQIIMDEQDRQRRTLVLIASENFTSKSVFDALGSVMCNKYSEGLPGSRYYGGNENIDKAENLCMKRALDAFNLDHDKWGVNVQPLSGTPANFQVYSAILKPHDRIMSLDLPDGGHLSHGYQTATKKISNVSLYFETFPYRLNPNTGHIDYDKMEEHARLYRPKLLIAGASAYAQLIDYERMRNIADMSNAFLLSDMAHISGLVSAGVIPSPFDFSDVVTTTTHKTLRGPRGGMIFYRKGVRNVDKKGVPSMYDLHERVNFAVFPGAQGGPHNHTISALSTALLQCMTPEYKAYQVQTLKNSIHFADELMKMGYVLVGNGTQNHLLLVNLPRSKDGSLGVDGARVERVMELAGLVCNKNTIPDDKSAMVPGGIRMGTPALTTRGFTEEDFTRVAHFFDRAVSITQQIKKDTGPKLKDFQTALLDGGGDRWPELSQLNEEVTQFSCSFPTIGFQQ